MTIPADSPSDSRPNPSFVPLPLNLPPKYAVLSLSTYELPADTPLVQANGMIRNYFDDTPNRTETHITSSNNAVDGLFTNTTKTEDGRVCTASLMPVSDAGKVFVTYIDIEANGGDKLYAVFGSRAEMEKEVGRLAKTWDAHMAFWGERETEENIGMAGMPFLHRMDDRAKVLLKVVKMEVQAVPPMAEPE